MNGGVASVESCALCTAALIVSTGKDIAQYQFVVWRLVNKFNILISDRLIDNDWQRNEF